MLNEKLAWKGVKIKGEFFKIESVRKSGADGYQYIQLEKNVGLGIHSSALRLLDNGYIYSTKHKDLSRNEIIFVI